MQRHVFASVFTAGTFVTIFVGFLQLFPYRQQWKTKMKTVAFATKASMAGKCDKKVRSPAPPVAEARPGALGF